MDRQAFGRAREEAGKAAQKIAEIREAKTLQEIADLWSSFLTNIQRSYTKLRIACRSGASKGWCDNVFRTRNADELLNYVLHARNADEHGVAKITDEKQGGIGIGPKQGNSLEIDHLEIGPERIVMGPKLAANARVTFTSGEILLVPVRDRGIVYDVPKKHLGEELGSATLLEVAERAERFLSGKLDEADARFWAAQKRPGRGLAVQKNREAKAAIRERIRMFAASRDLAREDVKAAMTTKHFDLAQFAENTR